MPSTSAGEVILHHLHLAAGEGLSHLRHHPLRLVLGSTSSSCLPISGLPFW